MILTDKYAYASNIYKLDPVAKVVFTAILLILCLFLNNVWVSIFLLFVSMVFTISTNPEINIIKYIKFISVPVIFLVTGIGSYIVTPIANLILKLLTSKMKYLLRNQNLNRSQNQIQSRSQINLTNQINRISQTSLLSQINRQSLIRKVKRSIIILKQIRRAMTLITILSMKAYRSKETR